MSLDIILRAAHFAALKHSKQLRKGADRSPYINHPLAVASLLANAGEVNDSNVLCAALLHDTIEDTDTTADELRAQFGDTITNLVLEVTNDKDLETRVAKQLEIEHAWQLSPQAKLVKLADKICNVSDTLSNPPVKWTLKRCEEYFDWSREVVAGARNAHPSLALHFDRLYARKDELAQRRDTGANG